MMKPQIVKCSGREIIDSRGNPTVEATVVLSDGTVGVASVPSGASTGIYEAVEKRDGDKRRFGGMGVLEAVNGICRAISPELVGCYAAEQSVIDRLMCELDGTENKENLTIPQENIFRFAPDQQTAYRCFMDAWQANPGCYEGVICFCDSMST